MIKSKVLESVFRARKVKRDSCIALKTPLKIAFDDALYRTNSSLIQVQKLLINFDVTQVLN